MCPLLATKWISPQRLVTGPPKRLWSQLLGFPLVTRDLQPRYSIRPKDEHRLSPALSCPSMRPYNVRGIPIELGGSELQGQATPQLSLLRHQDVLLPPHDGPNLIELMPQGNEASLAFSSFRPIGHHRQVWYLLRSFRPGRVQWTLSRTLGQHPSDRGCSQIDIQTASLRRRLRRRIVVCLRQTLTDQPKALG